MNLEKLQELISEYLSVLSDDENDIMEAVDTPRGFAEFEFSEFFKWVGNKNA